MHQLTSVASLSHAAIYQAGKVVVKNTSFEIQKGEFVYLIGKTGSGKSSILRTLYADLPLKQGNGKVVDFALETIQRYQIPLLRRQIGIVFQDFQLFTDRSVADNMFFVLEATGWKKKDLMLKRIEFVLLQVGLVHLQHQFPHQLSGGEQQRIAIARAMLNDPKIIFADEPTGNLDPVLSNEILDLFIKINKGGTAILMATHNHSFLKKHPSRVLYCENGELKDFDKEQVLQRFA